MFPADYEPVDFRIHRFYDKHPEGRILTELHTIHRNSDGTARQYIFKAEVYRDIKSVIPDAVGYAEETVGISTGPRASLLETCETSAIGRALANLGFSPKGFRPSAEEMEKSSSDLCKLCQRRQTTNHILSACPVALNQLRFTWRHDSVVSYIVNNVDSKKCLYDQY